MIEVTIWITSARVRVERTSGQPWGREPVRGETLTFDVTLPYPQAGPGDRREAQLGFTVDEVSFPDGRPPVLKCYVPDCPLDEVRALMDIGFKEAGLR